MISSPLSMTYSQNMGDQVSSLVLWNQPNPGWTPGIGPPDAGVHASSRSSSSRTRARAGVDLLSAVSVAARE